MRCLLICSCILLRSTSSLSLLTISYFYKCCRLVPSLFALLPRYWFDDWFDVVFCHLHPRPFAQLYPPLVLEPRTALQFNFCRTLHFRTLGSVVVIFARRVQKLVIAVSVACAPPPAPHCDHSRATPSTGSTSATSAIFFWAIQAFLLQPSREGRGLFSSSCQSPSTTVRPHPRPPKSPHSARRLPRPLDAPARTIPVVSTSSRARTLSPRAPRAPPRVTHAVLRALLHPAAPPKRRVVSPAHPHSSARTHSSRGCRAPRRFRGFRGSAACVATSSSARWMSSTSRTSLT